MVSFITRVCGFESVEIDDGGKKMVGCVKALTISMCASVGSMADLQSGYSCKDPKGGENGE
jgi:hypothetical protein